MVSRHYIEAYPACIKRSVKLPRSRKRVSNAVFELTHVSDARLAVMTC